MTFGVNMSLAQKTRDRKLNQQFDGIKEAVEQVELNPINERMAIAAISSMRMAAIAIALQTAMIVSDGQDDDSEDELLPSEVLDALVAEAVTDDDDDDDNEVNPTITSTLSAHIADAFSSLGVEDDVINDMFSTDTDVADTAIESAAQTVIENLPDDGEPLDEFVEAFAFGYDLDADGEDTEIFDAVSKPKKKLAVGKSTVKEVNGHKIKYKAIEAVRDGKIVVVNKRVSGTIILSAAQKAALRKARHKAIAPAALRKQMKSLTKGIKHDIYKITAGQAKALQRASLVKHNKRTFGF